MEQVTLWTPRLKVWDEPVLPLYSKTQGLRQSSESTCPTSALIQVLYTVESTPLTACKTLGSHGTEFALCMPRLRNTMDHYTVNFLDASPWYNMPSCTLCLRCNMDHGSLMICKAFHNALAISCGTWSFLCRTCCTLCPRCTMDQGFLTVRLAVRHAPGIPRNIVPLLYAYIYNMPQINCGSGFPHHSPSWTLCPR